MKKIWKMRKNREAVSPVIATILMVAITVVLAAVLYVMVMGFGGPSTQTPTGAFGQMTKLTATSEKVQFGVITPDTNPINVKVILSDTTAATSWSGTLPADTGAGTAVTMGGTTPPSVKYTSLAGGAKIGSADYLAIGSTTALVAGHTYTLTMIFVPTGNQIGATVTFAM
jgi:flagellin-like protein